MQSQLLFPFDVVKLKKGKDKCPCCGKAMRAYCKVLDKRLVDEAYIALRFLFDHNRKIFRLDEIFPDKDYRKINDFQKLHYFGIAQKIEKKSGFWKITDWGLEFLVGNRKLPKRVWVFNNKKIDEEQEYVGASEVTERWQETKADYALDYIPYDYKVSVRLNSEALL